MDGKSVILVSILCFLYCSVNCSLAETSSAREWKGSDGVEDRVRRSDTESGIKAGLCDMPACKCENVWTSVWINITCNFDSDQVIHVSEGMVPRTTRKLVISGAAEVVLEAQSFTGVEDPKQVLIQNVLSIRVSRHAIYKMNANHPLMQFFHCDKLVIEKDAFENSGTTTVNIFACKHVKLQNKSFYRLIKISIQDVPRLELEEGAFALEIKSDTRHGPVTKILLQNVHIESLPRRTFGSPVDEVRFQEVTIRDVHGDAFCAISYNTVIAINSTFNKFYKEAFHEKTLIGNKLEFLNCTIISLASDALLSAMNNLTIKYSKLKDIDKAAIRIRAAKVNIEDNEFGRIRSGGLQFQEWDRIVIKGNTFDELETDAIMCPIEYQSDPQYTLIFANNGMFKVASRSLKFISDIQSVHPIAYENNYFDQTCTCEMDDWLRDVFNGNSTPLQVVSNNSYCTVKDPTIARCYNIFVETMLVQKFTQEVCSNETKIKCVPAVTKNNSLNNDILNTKFLNRKIQLREQEETKMWNKRILIIVLIAALCGVLAILVVTFIACARRKGYCADVKNALISSNNCCVAIFDRLFHVNYGLDTARSISRLSVHEYNENHRLNETRMLNVENGAVEIEQLMEEDVPMVDKATQTLPEELTKELLESLREKLDDPENYSEAREMIEHLYDLIKVEESCNTNNNFHAENQIQDYIDDHENLYDIIQLPVRRQGKNKKIMINVGTRVPSLERLAPFSPYARPTALCHEYFEPKDRAPHLYCELPGDRSSDLPHSSKNMPDVVGERTSRPLSFLRAIGEKIQQPGESISATANMPTGTSGSSRSGRSSKMANRPLPEKPRDPGEGTSFQRP